MKYKSVFISDTHIGSRNSNINKLLSFLKDTECENLFIVGDFIDGWELKNKWRWKPEFNTLIQKILRKSRHGTNVYLIIGNHDDFLSHFENLEFGNIKVVRQHLHITANSKVCLVLHGDQFDGIIKYAKWLQYFGSYLYNWIIDWNTNINKILRKFGRTYSLAKIVKQKTKAALNFVNKFEDCVIQSARTNAAEIVVCGHIHTPADKMIEDIRYLNCGSWQEDEFHAVVEFENGEIKLIDL
jgi:UDP-2,3-diacylglucosamine pyrophosphatase LpxH